MGNFSLMYTYLGGSYQFYSLSRLVEFLLIFAPPFICLLSDELLAVITRKASSIHNVMYIKAMVDNFSHGLVAALSWLVAVKYVFSTANLVLTGLCSLIACGVDLDHFIAARSLYLRDALHLTTRPPLHNSSIVLLFIPILGVRKLEHHKWLQQLSMAGIIAILSHHLRDANRRGLWVYPFGSTPPLPRLLYLSLVTLLPLLVRELRTKIYCVDVPAQAGTNVA